MPPFFAPNTGVPKLGGLHNLSGSGGHSDQFSEVSQDLEK